MNHYLLTRMHAKTITYGYRIDDISLFVILIVHFTFDIPS